jgi:protein SCO1/2
MTKARRARRSGPRVVIALFALVGMMACRGKPRPAEVLPAPSPAAAPAGATATPPLPSFASPFDLSTLVDQEGRRFSFAALKGKTVVMNFIFTHCPVSCPAQTRALTLIQHAVPKPMASRVRFVSVTMDPERDTPPALKQYAALIGADLANWSFVTGNEGELGWLHHYYDVRVTRSTPGQFDHRVAVYLIDASGRLLQKYSGDFDKPRLLREIGEVDRLFNKT